jgi:hypothetical protein
LAAQVIDADDHPVGGVAADLYKVTSAGHVYWRAARTGANGRAMFGGNAGVIEGDYVVHVNLLPWHMLAPGEQNDRAIRVNAGDDNVVSFHVVPRLPGHPTLSPRSPQLRSLQASPHA